GNYAWFVPSGDADDVRNSDSNRNQRRQRGRDRLRMVARVRLEPLQINTQRRTFGSGPGQPVDDARTTRKAKPHPLVSAGRAVDRVGVGKIVRGLDRERSKALAVQARDLVAQSPHQLIRAIAGDALVIVTGVEVAAVSSPVLSHEPMRGQAALGKD